jgi:hypothetical protein
VIWQVPHKGEMVRHIDDVGQDWPAIVLEVRDRETGAVDLHVLAGQQGGVFVRGATPAQGIGEAGWRKIYHVDQQNFLSLC